MNTEMMPETATLNKALVSIWNLGDRDECSGKHIPIGLAAVVAGAPPWISEQISTTEWNALPEILRMDYSVPWSGTGHWVKSTEENVATAIAHGGDGVPNKFDGEVFIPWHKLHLAFMEEELGANWGKVQQLLDEVGHERFGEFLAASGFDDYYIDLLIIDFNKSGFGTRENTSAFLDGFFYKDYMIKQEEKRKYTIGDWAYDQLSVSRSKTIPNFYKSAQLFIDGKPWLLDAITSVISEEDINTQVPNYLEIEPNVSINDDLSADVKDEALKHSLVLEFLNEFGDLPPDPEEFISATKTLDEERVNRAFRRTVVGFVNRIKV